MDTDSLRLFVLAADKLNISAAGRKLGLAPAVASARLAKLEHALGADLLHRSTRKVSLSQQGAAFLPYAREMLAQEEAGLSALGRGEETPKGVLRFTAPSTFAQLYIAPIVHKFLARYPEITLDMRLSDLVYDLIEGSFDLAIRNSALEDTSLKGRKLAEDHRILCAAPSYLERRGTPQTPEELAGHDLVGFAGQEVKQLRGRNGAEGRFDPGLARNRLIVDDGASHKIATVAGAGIAFSAVWNVHKELQSGALVRVLPEYDVDDGAVLWLIYPKSNELSAKVRVFMDFLIEEIGKAPAWKA
ncbi:LysR family transcriptional regulator [Shimia marina]|uniref:D-malate degradation protein R n=1 Tax=Shimia marina TaxID=321267 RepID=A0A0P1EPH1_9RHOB|nr:LysR family transcriptional regulator [Shimia marina]CUH52195.1 D-malate degradation protein R [Shimia marina]SFE71851.1 transcriptional regulator, LysR family [Shimia marina]